MSAPHFDFEIEDDGTLVVLRLRGELDLSSLGRISEAVDERCRERPVLVVDLRELEFMDSSGLRLMVELNQRGGVSFMAAPPRVERLLDTTGVGKTLKWVDTPHDALPPGG